MATRVVGPLVNEYGHDLVVIGLDISAGGNEAYRAAMEHLEVPDDRRVVPFMLVGDRSLIGGGEIEAELPGIVADGLENGGIDWPAIPALDSLFQAANATLEARAAATAEGTPAPETTAEPTAEQQGPEPPPTAQVEPTDAPVPAEPPSGSNAGLLYGAAGAAAVAVAAAGVVWYRRRG